MKKKVVPRKGITMPEFARGVKGYSGREIHVRRSGVTIRLPYTVTMGIDAEYPNQMIATKKMHHGGQIIYFEEEIPEDKICAGADVYYQLIQRVVTNRKLTREAIKNALIHDLRVLPNTRWARRYIDKVIDEMEKYGYLSVEEERIGRIIKITRYTIGISITTHDEMYDFVRGYEPIAYHMVKYIEEAGGGGVPISELKYEFINARKWIRGEKMFENYINFLLSLGCIKIEGDRVKFKSPPPVNS